MEKKRKKIIIFFIVIVAVVLLFYLKLTSFFTASFAKDLFSIVLNKEYYTETNKNIDTLYLDKSCLDCNIILVTLDTTRADHLSAYGYERDTTPNISKLVKNSVVFNQAYSMMPYTPTSHWSIMTGLYPHTHGHFSPGVINESNQKKQTNFPFISKILKDNGYETSAFTGSKMVHGLNYGFDTFRLIPSGGKKNTAKETTNEVVDWIKKNKNKKFFTWIHYWDPHAPYTPPEEYVYPDPPNETFEKFAYMQRRYDGEIKYVDAQFSHLIERLKDLNIYKKTIIIITADHGESFGEHKRGDFHPNAPELMTRGHYQTLFDQEINVPLIISNPYYSQNKIIDSVVQSIDILPTILDVVGVSIPEKIEGVSLVSLVDGKNKGKNYSFSILKYVPNELREEYKKNFDELENFDKKKGLRLSWRFDKWKLIKIINIKNKENQAEEEVVSYQLYDMDSDESINVLDKNPEIAEELKKEIDSILKNSDLKTNKEQLTKEEVELLKSLGYIN